MVFETLDIKQGRTEISERAGAKTVTPLTVSPYCLQKVSKPVQGEGVQKQSRQSP